VPGADKQQQVAEAHRRTSDAMLALRSTLRDEHYYLLQVRAPMPPSVQHAKCVVSAGHCFLPPLLSGPEQLTHG